MTFESRPVNRREHAFWMLSEIAPGSAAAHLTVAFRTGRPLRWWPLQAAANHVLARHPALRSRFPVHHGVPVREVSPAGDAEILVEVVAATPDDFGEKVGAAARQPFDLAADLLFRLTMFQLSDGGTAVAMTVHHIVADAVSLAILTSELAAAYDAFAADREPALPSAPGDLGAPAPAPADVRFWVDHLRGFRPSSVELPWGGPRPARPTFAGQTLMIPMPAAAADAVDRLRRGSRTTENLVLLSAFYLTLFRHGADRDLVVGVPMSTRSRADQSAVGFGVSTVPLRLRIDAGAGFEQLARQVRDLFFAGMAHAGTSIEDLLTELGHRTTDWRTPVFRHQFNYRPWNEADISINGERPHFLEVVREESRLDIDLTVVGGIRPPVLGVTFSTEVHRVADIRAMLARMCALLESAARDPGAAVATLDMLTTEDRAVIGAGGAPKSDAPERTVPDRIRSVARAGAGTALVSADGEHSYADVLADADRVAGALRAAGVRHGDTVAVTLGRGAPAAAAMIGTWGAGAAFVPLDVRSPSRRLRIQLADADVRAVIAADDESAPWAEDCRVVRWSEVVAAAPAPSPARPDPADTAYVIYTSGSTGRPKGVRTTHRNLANAVVAFGERLAASPDDAMLWLAATTFDPSLLELFLPLTLGGRVVVADSVSEAGVADLLDTVVRHDARLLQATPTVWRLVAAAAGDQLRGRTAICGGEPLTADLATDLLRLGCRLFNVYGPTETTIWSTVAEITDPGDEPVPVGRPIPNVRMFVLGRYGEELGCGLVGELCVAGAGVSAGYPCLPELTAERFGDHPTYGPFYRSGDLGRWRPDGTIDCLGRIDRQVKLRGQRIELGEVEAALADHDEVAGAAAMVVGDPQGDGELRVFVRPVPGAADHLPDRLWRHLRLSLPTGMLPSAITVVDRFPVTANGKLDYAALARTAPPPGRHAGRPLAAGSDADPRLTDALTELWRECLDRPELGADDNFFLNGGHSLLATRLAERVAGVLGRTVPLRVVFDWPTARELAHALADGGAVDVRR